MGRPKKLTELINEASVLTDETFDNSNWVQWFNNAIDDLADVVKLDTEVKIQKMEDTGVFPLPDNFISAVEVTLPSGMVLAPLRKTDKSSTGYKIRVGNIVLQGVDSNEIQLYYYRRPTYMTTASDKAIDVPDDCVRAVIYFACAQAMLREDETERYNNFIEEYSNAKTIALAAQKSKQSGGSGQWKVIR